MEWWYVQASTVDYIAEQVVGQQEREKQWEKEKIACYLMNHKTTGTGFARAIQPMRKAG